MHKKDFFVNTWIYYHNKSLLLQNIKMEIQFSQLGASKKAKLTVKGGAVVDPDTGKMCFDIIFFNSCKSSQKFSKYFLFFQILYRMNQLYKRNINFLRILSGFS